MSSSIDFDRALDIGRPPNIQKLFPHSRALIVSGKVIDRALLAKGRAMTMAANGRNHIVIRGALQAAQRAKAAIIIEIARSEGGAKAYCATNFWNMARQVDAVCNELGITVPVAIHADHYGIKKRDDLPFAQWRFRPFLMPGLPPLPLMPRICRTTKTCWPVLNWPGCIPSWAGFETEVGEIKGKLAFPRLRSPVPDPGAQCPRYFSGLDCPEQRHNPWY